MTWLQRLNINGNLISALHPMPLLTELWMESNALQVSHLAIPPRPDITARGVTYATCHTHRLRLGAWRD